jgi:hypothetical protein
MHNYIKSLFDSKRTAFYSAYFESVQLIQFDYRLKNIIVYRRGLMGSELKNEPSCMIKTVPMDYMLYCFIYTYWIHEMFLIDITNVTAYTVHTKCKTKTIYILKKYFLLNIFMLF